MLQTAICDLFGIEYPIIQGGMVWVSTAELVSAVSNAGGLGIVGTGNSDPDWVRRQIHLTRQRTSQPFGVNIFLATPFLEQVVAVVVEEKVAVVAFGAGNPEGYIPGLKQVGIKVMATVSSVAQARRMERAGVDAIVAEGMEAGGEVGEVTTMALVPQVVDSVQIPVVAAGGIGDGRGLVAALVLGAQGVQMGTRFVCSDECVAHPSYKKKILGASGQSTILTGQTMGSRLRCLQNSLTQRFLALERSGATREELDWFSRGRMYQGSIEGNVDDGLLLSGQVAGLIKDIKPVRVIIQEMITEAEAIISGLKNRGINCG